MIFGGGIRNEGFRILAITTWFTAMALCIRAGLWSGWEHTPKGITHTLSAFVMWEASIRMGELRTLARPSNAPHSNISWPSYAHVSGICLSMAIETSPLRIAPASMLRQSLIEYCFNKMNAFMSVGRFISSSIFCYVVAVFLIALSCSCSSHRAASHDFSGTSSAFLSQSMAMCGEGSREFGFDSIVVVGDFPTWPWASVCQDVCASGANNVPSSQRVEQKRLPSVLDSFPSLSYLRQGCSNLSSDTARIGQSHQPVSGAVHGRGMRIAIYGGRSSAAGRLTASSQANGSRADSCSLHEEEAEDAAHAYSRIDFFVPMLVCGLLFAVLIIIYRKCSRGRR